MRFVLTSQGMEPQESAIIPRYIERVASDKIAQITDAVTHWLVTDGITLVAEFALVWGMICFLVAVTGSGQWIERGAKAVLLSVALGVVRYVV
jgi:hypothetical protein